MTDVNLELDLRTTTSYSGCNMTMLGGTGSMTFVYTLLDLGGLDHREIEAALNQFGAEGWELVAIIRPQTAIFKCAAQNASRPASGEAQQSVAAKYRDPETGKTWSGRGRMATWLAEKVRSGAQIEDYLA